MLWSPSWNDPLSRTVCTLLQSFLPSEQQPPPCDEDAVQTRDWRTILTAIRLIRGIVYDFAFLIRWSAATGYLSPSQTVYKTASDSYARADEFRTCYQVIDGSGTGLVDTVNITVEADFDASWYCNQSPLLLP